MAPEAYVTEQDTTHASDTWTVAPVAIAPPLPWPSPSYATVHVSDACCVLLSDICLGCHHTSVQNTWPYSDTCSKFGHLYFGSDISWKWCFSWPFCFCSVLFTEIGWRSIMLKWRKLTQGFLSWWGSAVVYNQNFMQDMVIILLCNVFRTKINFQLFYFNCMNLWFEIQRVLIC